MARRRRLDAALRRLRRGGNAPAPANGPGEGPETAEPPRQPGAPQLALGELSASRREVAAARLRALREPRPAPPRPPDQPPPPGLPAGSATTPGSPPPPPRPPGDGRGFRDRLTALGHAARLRATDAVAAVGQRWRELPRIARQRIAAAAIVALLVAIVVWIVIPAAPCGAPGGSSCGAEDDAIALVPADALAYVHVVVGPDAEELAAASDYAERLPLLSGLLVGSASEIAGQRVDFATQVAPWADGEVALAVLPPGATVTMIETEDPEAARRFADRLIDPTSTEQIGGLGVALGERGSAAALVDGFLLIGDAAAVRTMVEDEGIGSLGTAAAATGIDDLPDDSFAYAYLSGDGARALLAGGRALTGLDALINARGSSAVTAALSFDGGRASLTIRSAQDPDLAAADPPLTSTLPQFDPALDAEVGADALAYLGFGGPAADLGPLLARARRRAPDLAAAIDRVEADGISISGDLLPLLGTEAALSIEPVAGEGTAEIPGVLAPAGVPYVSLIVDGADGAADLADLQKPLAAALAPKRGEAAGFEPLQIAGIEAQSLAVSPNVELTYATYDDRLIVATKPIGIAQARAGGDGLADSDDYRAVTATMPAEVSLLAYFDLRDLLSLGEQVGLAEDPAYARLASDLRTLQAAALSIDDSGGELRTDVSVTLGEAPDPVEVGAE